MEEYFGIGSTPETALDCLADDMAQNRIDIGVFDCTPYEMMQAIGNVLKESTLATSTKSPIGSSTYWLFITSQKKTIGGLQSDERITNPSRGSQRANGRI